MKFLEVSRSALYSIVTEQLRFRKVCARWVPMILTDNNKTHRMGATLEFLDRYNTDGDFLKSIVTGDETWILYDMPKRKQQSQQWITQIVQRGPQNSNKPSTAVRLWQLFFGTKKVCCL